MNIFNEIDLISGKTMNFRLELEKAEGRKIMGYFCSYVPEELIHAAGFIPYRMRAVESAGTKDSSGYFSSTNCSYVRHCFDKALNGKFNFLDGLVFMNGCDHSRRMYDNWLHAGIKPDFMHFLTVPHILSGMAVDQYTGQLNKLKSSIENAFQVNITPSALEESVSLYNKKRALLRTISEMRKHDIVPVRGSEFLKIMSATTAIPVEDSITILQDIIKNLDGRSVSSGNDIRVVFTGCGTEEVEYLELIEDCGASIVADKICLGSPYYATLVKENTDDPVSALSERYLTNLSCPRMVDDFRRRIQSIKQTIESFHADALILDKLEFCTYFSGESLLFQKEMKELGVPVIALDREFLGGNTGQIKTRVQAFCEKVNNLKAKI